MLRDIQQKAYYIYLRTGCTQEKVNWEQAQIEIQQEQEYRAKMAIMHQKRPDIFQAPQKLSPHERELSHKAKVRAYYYWKQTGNQDTQKNYYLALEEEQKIEKYRYLEQKWSQYLDVINRCIDHQNINIIRWNKHWKSRSPGKLFLDRETSPYRDMMQIFSISELSEAEEEMNDVEFNSKVHKLHKV